MNAKKKHPGTVPVDGGKVRNLRNGKGWSLTTLSKRSGCSIVTLKSIEAGGEAFPSTLEKIAKPLNVNYRDLLVGSMEADSVVTDEKTDTVPVGNVEIRVFIFIVKDFDKENETDIAERVAAKIKEEADMAGAIPVVSITRGSIIIETVMNYEDTLRLLASLYLEKFSELQIDKVKVRTSSVVVEDLSEFLTKISEGRRINQVVSIDRSEITVYAPDTTTPQLLKRYYTERLLPLSWAAASLLITSFFLPNYFYFSVTMLRMREGKKSIFTIENPTDSLILVALANLVTMLGWGFSKSDFAKKTLRYAVIGGIVLFVCMKIIKEIAFWNVVVVGDKG